MHTLWGKWAPPQERSLLASITYAGKLAISVIIVIFNHGQPPVAQKLQKEVKVFGSEPYSGRGRSSSIKPSCSRTELNCCIEKNKEAPASPVVSTNYLPNSLKNWASLLIGSWNFTEIGTNSIFDESLSYLSALYENLLVIVTTASSPR